MAARMGSEGVRVRLKRLKETFFIPWHDALQRAMLLRVQEVVGSVQECLLLNKKEWLLPSKEN
jgi:hypothetical protein